MLSSENQGLYAFAYSGVTTHRSAEEYRKLSQITWYQGQTSVARGIKAPRA